MAVERTPVLLRVWGRTDFDRDRARADASVEAATRDWEIVETQQSSGGRNPIPRRDRTALGEFGHYNRAWAIYPAQAPVDEGQGGTAPGQTDA